MDILHVIEATIMGFSGLYGCGHIFLRQTALNYPVWLKTQNVLCAIHLFINQAGLIGEFFWGFGLKIHLLLHHANRKGEFQGYFTDFGV